MSELLSRVGAWLLTYLVHSTAMLGAAVLLSHLGKERLDDVKEAMWRVAIFGPIATASLQLLVFASNGTRITLDAPGGQVTTSSGALASMGGSVLSERVLPLLVVLWGIVAVIRCAFLVRAYFAIHAQLADRVALKDPRMLSPVNDFAGAYRIRLTSSSAIASPLVIGHREICLPARALREMSVPEIDAVLAHEVAHVVRGDRAWLSLATIVNRILFIQPLNGIACAHLRACAERACDDWAIMRVDDRKSLASALTRVAEWTFGGGSAPVLAVAMATRESLTMQRMRRIADPQIVRTATRHRLTTSVVAAGGLSLVVLLAPGVALDTATPAAHAPAIPYTISAKDDAGRFTLTVDRGRVVAMTLDGARLDEKQVHQAGNAVRVSDRLGSPILALTLTESGGIRWTSRHR